MSTPEQPRTRIPDDELPHLHADQIPPFITDDQQLYRWKVCAGITLKVCQRLDPVFWRELYDGDMPD